MAGFERFVGLRFLRPRRKQVFLSIITIISIGGLALGVATLIVVISVITGFQDYMEKKSMEAYSHIIVLSFTGMIDDHLEVQKKVAGYAGVRGASPFVYNEVMLNYKDNVGGAVLRGIDPESFKTVSNLWQQMDQGELSDLDKKHARPIDAADLSKPPEMYPAIVIGSELAATLHVFPGDVIGVVTPLGESTPLGFVPKMRRFVVTGLFTLGLYEFDTKFAFINMKEAQDFFGIGDRITGIELKVDDIWKAPEIAMKMNNDLGWPFKARDWTKLNESLFAALKLEKLVMFLILCIIIFVASLNIFTTLYMMVKDKQRAIAIMRTMGANGASIRRIFMVEGSVIGVIGSVLGLLLGAGICLAQLHFKLVRIDPKVYLIDTLPMKLDIGDFLIISAAAMGMALLATWIPAILASRVDPVKVLRYE